MQFKRLYSNTTIPEKDGGLVVLEKGERFRVLQQGDTPDSDSEIVYICEDTQLGTILLEEGDILEILPTRVVEKATVDKPLERKSKRVYEAKRDVQLTADQLEEQEIEDMRKNLEFGFASGKKRLREEDSYDFDSKSSYTVPHNSSQAFERKTSKKYRTRPRKVDEDYDKFRKKSHKEISSIYTDLED